MSILSSIPLAPRDPILGLTEAFLADDRADKVNLGVGVYLGPDGKVPLLECVRTAEAALAAAPAARGYQPIDGLPAYTRSVRELVFGAGSEPVASGRVVTIQGLGGTGALKIGAVVGGAADTAAIGFKAGGSIQIGAHSPITVSVNNSRLRVRATACSNGVSP